MTCGLLFGDIGFCYRSQIVPRQETCFYRIAARRIYLGKRLFSNRNILGILIMRAECAATSPDLAAHQKVYR